MSRLTRFLRSVSLAGGDAHRPYSPPGPRICLLHIMKTAGTSLRSMLEDDLGPKAIYPNAQDLATRPNGWYPLADEVLDGISSLRAHRLLVGHFPVAILAALPEKYQGAVFLRDPVQRSLSALAHYAEVLRSSPKELVHDTEFMGTKILDYQTKILGSDSIDDPNQHNRVDDGTLDRALNRVESLEFVGITERFAESCRVFDAHFGTTIARNYKRENVRRPDGREHDELISLVRPFVRRDFVLYERAKERFEQDLSSCAMSHHT